ncbi:unnamed protein product [Cochlearia groenlandica]
MSPILATSPSSSTIDDDETNDGLMVKTHVVSIVANDLLIVGPGVLGCLVAKKWREEHQGCTIYGQTITTNHHQDLVKLGIKPSLKDTKSKNKFSHVIFCAPPSQSYDYAAELRMASSKWNGEGSFLFTSSSAPYDCFDNGECNEDSPVVPVGYSPRTDTLLKAEKVDAASLAVAIMKKKTGSRVFLGCDNHPLTMQKVMDLMIQSGKYEKKFKGFTSTSGPLGKKLNNSRTRDEIGWKPKYPSFSQFLGIPK